MKRSEIINMKTIALIFAGGVGARMKHPNLPKQFIKVEDKPIIIHTIEYFELNKNVDEIYVVCVKEYIDYLHELIAEFKITKVKCVVPGGKTGQDSIYNGLVEINKNNNDNKSIIVLIHDGVRPLITNKIINDAIKVVKKHGVAIPVIKCSETIINKKENDDKIISVPLRKESFVAQAPQAFFLNEILDAHNKIRKVNPTYDDVIDSCTLYYLLGKKIYVYEGIEENIKITTAKDLYLLDALLKYQRRKYR